MLLYKHNSGPKLLKKVFNECSLYDITYENPGNPPIAILMVHDFI